MNELALKYGCNPNQKPSRIYMEDGSDLPVTVLNIAVLVSGGGTNLQALLDSEARGENPNGRLTLVVASKPGVYALERAAKAGVEGLSLIHI